jgi:beta-glucosidase-like glycosyl hydrolase
LLIVYRHFSAFIFAAAGPAGLGASFNRSSWRAKGTVIGNEMRALRNIGASRFAPGNKFKIGLTGFGPNINIVRDPRFGRNRCRRRGD